MISDNLRNQINKALKEGDEIKVSTLKLLSAALTNAEIAKKREKLTKEEELEVVRFEAKKRKDAIEALRQAQGKSTKLNQSEAELKKRLEQEKEELKILQKYLPKELTKEELEKIVDTVVEQTNASSMADMGKVMGAAMGEVKGRADGNFVMEIVKKKLS